GADQNPVLERKRSRRELEIGLIAVLLVPDYLASLGIGRDDAAVVTGDRDDEIAPQRDTAVAVGLLLTGIHLPDDLTLRASAHVDLVDHAPDVGDVYEPIVDQGCRLDIFVAGLAAERECEDKPKIPDVRLVDDVEW